MLIFLPVVIYVLSSFAAFMLCSILTPAYLSNNGFSEMLRIIFGENSSYEGIITPLLMSIIINLIVGYRLPKITKTSAIAVLLALLVFASDIVIFYTSFGINNDPSRYKYDLPMDEYRQEINRYISDNNFAIFLDSKSFSSLNANAFIETITISNNTPVDQPDKTYQNPENFNDLVRAANNHWDPEIARTYLEQAAEILDNPPNGEELDKNYIALFWHIRGSYEDDYDTKMFYFGEAIDAYNKLWSEFGMQGVARVLELAPEYGDAKEAWKKVIFDYGSDGLYFTNAYNSIKKLIFHEYDNICQSEYSVESFKEVLEDLYYLRWVEGLGPRDIQVACMIGAITLFTNTHLEQANECLVNMNIYLAKGHPFTKILLLCVKMKRGIVDQELLSEIINMSEQLTNNDKIYLADYWLSMEQYDNIYSYVYDIPSNNSVEILAKKSLLFASWYINSSAEVQPRTVKVINDSFKLISDKEYKGSVLALRPEYVSVLKMVNGYVGYSSNKYSYREFVDTVSADHNSMEATLFVRAISSYNFGDFKTSFETCEIILQLYQGNNTLDEYFIRLVKADAHYQYASLLTKGSEAWEEQISAAEKECNYFEDNTRYIIYLSKGFYELKADIYYQMGKPELQEEYNKKASNLP